MRVTAAVAWQAGGPVEVTEVDLDDPRPDEILVRVEAVGICHTDLAALSGHLPGVSLPMILGHEGTGTVERVGSGVTRVAAGDRVLLTGDSCGQCRECLAGRLPYCDDVVAYNFGGLRPDGSTRARRGDTAIRASFFGQSSFADHCLVTERNVYRVDKDADPACFAALTCGVPTGAGAILNAMPVGPGAACVVFGVGAVGLGAVMAAVASGADEVIAVDRVPERLQLAAELGATHVIDATDAEPVDLVTEIRHVTDGGCDVAFDNTGVPAVTHTAIESLRTRGVCGFVASSGGDFTVPALPMLIGGKTLRGIMGPDCSPALVLPRLLSLHRRGRFPFERLVRNYPFEQINTAFADSLSGRTIKPVLTLG
jgi:aryl-alcohol dehydrogenase